jgi:co-chaperonin GroES (HSP10)
VKIKPLAGQVLLAVKPRQEAECGIEIPESSRESRQPVREAKVLAIGPWKKINGFALLPEFGIGATVLVSDYSGTKIDANPGNMRLVHMDDVLAVLTISSD